jgi:hypothetical protein
MQFCTTRINKWISKPPAHPVWHHREGIIVDEGAAERGSPPTRAVRQLTYEAATGGGSGTTRHYRHDLPILPSQSIILKNYNFLPLPKIPPSTKGIDLPILLFI